MTSMGWDDLYAEVQSGVTGVEEGNYRLKVVSARPRAQSRLLFLNLGIQAGPLAGKVAEVKLYLPKPEQISEGSGFYFRKRIAGFGDLSATFAAMGQADPDGTNVEGALTVLATALVEKEVDGRIELVKEGEYAGTNELAFTAPLGTLVEGPMGPTAPPAAAPTAAPAVVAAPAPAPSPAAAPAAVQTVTVAAEPF